MNWFMFTFLFLIENSQGKSLQDATLINSDTNKEFGLKLDGLEKEETAVEQPPEIDLNEIEEAIETGTYKPKDATLINSDTNKEFGLKLDGLEKEETAVEQPPEIDFNEVEEAIETGTYEPKADDFEKPDGSWLPPNTAVTEEIDKINTDNGVKQLVDGDILPPPLSAKYRSSGAEDKRNALRDQAKLWRSRELPYLLDSSLSVEAGIAIKAAMFEIASKTCIKFKKINNPSSQHYIQFTNLGGCFSYVGKISGAYQNISIGSGCEHKGVVIHEIMHALGFYHEQSRFDRDKYIRIDFSNVIAGRERNFYARKIEEVTGLGLPYDFDGIMHYGAYAFALNKTKPTIIKINNTGGNIGQRRGLSYTDVEQLKTLYDCKTDSDKNSWSSWSSWSGCINLSKGRREYSQRFCFRENLAGCAGASSDGTQWRDRACGSGPAVPNKPLPHVPSTASPYKIPFGKGGINEAICGTRSNGLSHPGLEPQNIVGGTVVQPGDWPWQIGFARSGSTFIYCGGTLISNEWIVSAAHCFTKTTNPSMITARIGEHDKNTNEGREEVIRLAKIINHPNYNRRTMSNDIALIKLSRPVSYTEFIRPACLPETNTIIQDRQESFVSGWGATSEGGRTSGVLKVAKVPIVPQSTCRRSVRVGPTMICAGYAKGGIDSCQGDSGGPLVYRNSNNNKFYLAGAVSWGIGCARPTKYGVYARVTALRKWIDSVLPFKATQQPQTSRPEPVKKGLSCNFDKNACNWYDDDMFVSQWKRVKTATTIRDHTTEKGFFMAITPSKTVTSASITSSMVSSSQKEKCLELFYKLTGPSKKTLTVSMSDPSKKDLKIVTESKGSLWNLMTIPIKASRPVSQISISISGTINGQQNGDMIAIDDVTLIDSSCSYGKAGQSPSLLTCAFETNICYWKQANNDNFDWTRRMGRTPSAGTGPSMSATGSVDYYAYIETSYPRRNKQFATLRSPKVYSNVPSCLSFKANMYGSGINTLTVSAVLESSGKRLVLYEKKGNQGKNWFDVNVDMPSEQTFQVDITASRGKDYKGDIAVDEIRVYPRRCGAPGLMTTPKPTAMVTTALLTCAFEINICYWKQANNDNFDWTRRKSRTPSAGTGPSMSATGSLDYYAYIETSYPRRNKQFATLRSPKVFSNVLSCLSFKANMYGSGINTLTVSAVLESSGKRLVLYEKKGNQGKNWFDVNVDMPSEQTFQVDITASRGKNYRGDIAIDEIRVYPRRCGGAPGLMTTPKPAAVVPTGCGVPKVSNLRVIAGINAKAGSWPWQILMLFNGRPMCGGTLINVNTVVTAAHCVSGRESQHSNFRVRVGEYDTRISEGTEDTIQVSKIESHPKYSRRTIDYDIAVIKLAKSAKLGTYVGTACLPNANDEPSIGTDCYITGFGKIKHPGSMHHTLQQARLKVQSKDDCSKVNKKYGIPISPRMICAGNGQSTQQSGCHGDSGGPFVCQKAGRWFLHGAVSWGDSTCSAAKGYTVFAKTSDPEINAWIKKKARN